MNKAEIQDELSKKGAELATWRQLVEHAGWKWYKDTMEKQRNLRLFTVGETPLKSFGEALGQEFMKGEGCGIGLSLTLPYTMIEVLTSDVTRLSTQLEMENDNVQEDSNSGSRSRVDDSSFHGE